jgi:formamidase
MTQPQHIKLDLERSILEDSTNSHNRWHPDIPPVAWVEPGETFKLDVRDGFDVQVFPDSTSQSVASFDFDSNHPMTGPVGVRGAEPGDLLVVDVIAVDAVEFGSTLFIEGFGVLGDIFVEPHLVRWFMKDGLATSPDLPGVTLKGHAFLGLMGVAPSREMLERATKREGGVVDEGGAALLPTAHSAAPAAEPIASEGLRTIPPRENGGNMDCLQMGPGARVYIPVQVPGALLSVGDTHYAQGDGEACATAIECGSVATLRVDLIKKAAAKFTPRTPMYRYTQPVPSAPRTYICTTGLPVRDDGSLAELDIRQAARNAVGEMIDYLEATRGYTRGQAYALISVAADMRLTEAVDFPNPMVSVALPLDIFDEPPSNLL